MYRKYIEIMYKNVIEIYVVKYDIKIWYQNMISKYDIKIWYHNMISYYDIIFWYHILISYFDIIFWYHISQHIFLSHFYTWFLYTFYTFSIYFLYKNRTFLACFHDVLGGRKIQFSNIFLGWPATKYHF